MMRTGALDIMPDRFEALAETRPAAAQVLLVEDHRLVRHVMARALRAAGYGVWEAENAGQALLPERVDAAVIDVSLPGGMNGLEFGRIARRRWAGMPIVFVTGLMDFELPEPVPQDRTTRLLHKPFGAREIVALVNALLTARFGRGDVPAAE